MDQFLRPPIVRSYSQKAWTALTVVFSAIGVIGFHAFSLYGTERNWTTPTYGQLNAPGWYHGLFMFAQLYLLIGFAIRQMVTVRLMWKYNISGRQAEAAWQINIRLLVWFEVLLGCFGGLLATDKLVASANAHMMLLTLMQEPTVLIELLVGLPLCLATLLTNRLFGKSISPLQILSILILSAAAPVVTIVAVHAVQ